MQNNVVNKVVNKYQDRYLAHQARKKVSLSGKYEPELNYTKKEQETLEKIFTNRHSSRVFNGEKITDKELEYIDKLVKSSPSSCDRKGVKYVIIEDREDKELLNGLLVGGVGWIHRADKIVLLIADMEAYGSPNERDFMHYLDAGVLIQSFYLACEALGIKCCYVNPNIRNQYKDYFNTFMLKPRFTVGIGSDYIYCGAIALGK